MWRLRAQIACRLAKSFRPSLVRTLLHSLSRESWRCPLAAAMTDRVRCATAIGFNVETVTYKNIKFQAGRPAIHMLACIAALNAPSWLGQAVDQHCALGVAAGALRWRRVPKRICPAEQRAGLCLSQ